MSLSFLLTAQVWAQATSSKQAEPSPELLEASKLSQQVVTLYTARRYAEALPLAIRAAEIRERVLGPQHELLGASLRNLAEIYLSQEKYSEAERLLKRSLSILENRLGTESKDLIVIIERIAFTLFSERDFSGSELHYLRPRITEKNFGAEKLETGRSLEALAAFYEVTQNYKKAAEFYERSLVVKEKVLGPTDTQIVNLLFKCGCALREVEQPARARAYLDRAEKIVPSPPLNQGVIQGTAIVRVQPIYPRVARNARIAGPVVVEVVVDECGRVVKASKLSGRLELVPAALQAAEGWRFTPTLLMDRPRKVIGTITFNFTL
jgi:TonB family protein